MFILPNTAEIYTLISVPSHFSIQQIAQSLKDEQKKVPAEASFSDVRLEETEPNHPTKPGMS